MWATSRLPPAKVKPHLLQYAQECTSQFSGHGFATSANVGGLALAHLLFSHCLSDAMSCLFKLVQFLVLSCRCHVAHLRRHIMSVNYLSRGMGSLTECILGFIHEINGNFA